MLAEKEINETFYEEWCLRLEKAMLDQSKEKEQKLGTLYEEIEDGMKLVGSVAVEDKLQEECKETIEAIRGAGIKFWVLTGDKIETAINIGK